MRRARSLAEAVRRLNALVRVLDEDLRDFEVPNSIPEGLRDLSGEDGAAARGAIRLVEASLEQLERPAVEARRGAQDWLVRERRAKEGGHSALARQAHRRAEQEEEKAAAYEREIAAMRELLDRCRAVNYQPMYAMSIPSDGPMPSHVRLRFVPDQLQTRRLMLRRWRESDAPALQPVLAANVAHLGPWIPRRVSEPAELPALAERLAEFSAAFDDAREWRYGLFDSVTGDVLGEVSLFPRNEKGRVTFDVADHIEIGYWVRGDACGRGLATEATRAVMALALGLPDIDRLTIHCDERNVASAAIPRRLGFRLVDTLAQAAGAPEGSRLQVWVFDRTQDHTRESQTGCDAGSRMTPPT